MMSLKKQLIKNYIKMQLLSNMPGELHIRMANLSNLSKDYVEFAPYVYDAIKLLNGINDSSEFYNRGSCYSVFTSITAGANY